MQNDFNKINMMKKNEKEFERMVHTHKSTIYTVCYMFSKDQDEVNDLFQEVLMNLWINFDTFQGRSDIKTWIYRVSLNVCVSLDKKKRKTVRRVPLRIDMNPFEDTDNNSLQMEMLRKRIARLGPFDRAVIMLWLENMSYDDIGAVMGISAKNVSVKLYRIKEQLRKMSDEAERK